MKYIVEDFFAGYYISNCPPSSKDEDYSYPEVKDKVILSFEDDKKLDTLNNYFSREKASLYKLGLFKEQEYTKEYMLRRYIGEFEDDRCLIEEFEKAGIINKEEKLTLFKTVSKNQKKQFELIKQVFYPEGYIRRKQLKKNRIVE